MKKISYIAVLAMLGILIPFMASAQTTNMDASSTPYEYQSNGIYGCNKTGATASSVGAFSASGAYVPVSDAAVELNTGYLVYLECSLRPLVDSLSQSATAGLINKTSQAYTQGNNGGPQFSQNINNENAAVMDKVVVPAISTVSAATGQSFQSAIQAALARSYAANTRNPTGSLACPYSSSQISGNVWTGIASIGVPSCDVLIDYENAYDMVMGAGANAVQNNMTELGWGGGTYPITSTDANGNVNVVTPGAIILNQEEQALQAGFTKTENANDIGQMVNSLFAGIGAQALSSAQGLMGLTQSSNGQPSYLDQVALSASQNVQTNAVNAAITELNGVLTTVTNYQNSLDTIGNTLSSAMQTLRGDEVQCWSNIIQNVCVGGAVSYSNGVATCKAAGIGGATSTSAVTLKVSTSTAFSQAVISPQIGPLVTQTAADITAVQSTINAVNSLIAGVTNTTSQAVQNAALQQLDQLTASNSFPTQADMSNASQEAASINTTMGTLVTTTVQNWQGYDQNTGAYDVNWNGQLPPNGTDVGWCNYNSPSTLAIWESYWKQ